MASATPSAGAGGEARRTFSLAAVSAGLALATCCFPALAEAVGSLGLWAIPAIAASGLLCWLVSRVYAELAGLFPTAAGVRTYVGQAFGRRRGQAIALLSLALIVSIGAAETYVLSQVLGRALPGIAPLPVIVAFIAACAAANILGFEPATGLQALLTYGIIGAIGAVSLAVLSGVSGAAPLPPASAFPGLASLVAGTASVTFLFVGFEWVVTSVEDAGDQGRTLPRAMTWSIALLGATYALLAAALFFAVGSPALKGEAAPHLALGAAWGGRAGLLLMAAISIAATVTTFNSGILGASRLTYALAREGALPRFLARLHPRFLTPWPAVLAVTAVAAASALALARSGTVHLAILLGAASECAVFAVVALALSRLRRTQPLRARPYRAPFGPRTAKGLALVFGLLAVATLISAGGSSRP